MNQIEKTIFIVLSTIIGIPFLLIIPQELMLHFNINDIFSILLAMFAYMLTFLASMVIYAFFKALFIIMRIYAKAIAEVLASQQKNQLKCTELKEKA